MQALLLARSNGDVFSTLQQDSLMWIINVSNSLVNGHKNQMQRNIKI